MVDFLHFHGFISVETGLKDHNYRSLFYEREGLSEVRLIDERILSVLYPPEGAQCFGDHSGSSSGSGYHIVYSQIFLKTDLDPKKLEAYYRNHITSMNVIKRGIQWKGTLTVQTIDKNTKMIHLLAIAQY